MINIESPHRTHFDRDQTVTVHHLQFEHHQHHTVLRDIPQDGGQEQKHQVRNHRAPHGWKRCRLHFMHVLNTPTTHAPLTSPHTILTTSPPLPPHTQESRLPPLLRGKRNHAASGLRLLPNQPARKKEPAALYAPSRTPPPHLTERGRWRRARLLP